MRILIAPSVAVIISFLGFSPIEVSQNTPPAIDTKIRIDQRIDHGVDHAIVLNLVRPAYPPEAKANGIQGTVRIAAIINKDGIPEKLRLLSGPPELVSASLDAIMQWRYKPYKLNGVAVPVETTITIRYMIPRTRPSPRTERRAH